MIFVVMVSTYRDSFFIFNNACAVGLSDATGTSVGLARFPVAAPTQSIDTINTCANANLMVLGSLLRSSGQTRGLSPTAGPTHLPHGLRQQSCRSQVKGPTCPLCSQRYEGLSHTTMAPEGTDDSRTSSIHHSATVSYPLQPHKTPPEGCRSLWRPRHASPSHQQAACTPRPALLWRGHCKDGVDEACPTTISLQRSAILSPLSLLQHL